MTVDGSDEKDTISGGTQATTGPSAELHDVLQADGAGSAQLRRSLSRNLAPATEAPMREAEQNAIPARIPERPAD